MEKLYSRIVYIVLVYKNIDVTEGFYNSLKGYSDYKVIVVNSFFDSQTEKQCKRMAEEHGSDYISIANKGFGYGNNIGIEYALRNYTFEYLIISNSDIVVKDISCLYKNVYKNQIIAPDTFMPNGKRQNPCSPFYNKPFLFFLEMAFDKNDYRIARIGHAFNRLSIILFRLANYLLKGNHNIFMPHGSFIIFHNEVLPKMTPMFNEKIFLYNEELYLGLKAKKLGVSVVYNPNIKVLHLEGASTNAGFKKQFKYHKDSFSVIKTDPLVSDLL